MTIAHPLLRHGRLDAAFAFHRGVTRSVGDFLGDIETLAGQLPARRHIVNLCSDRYRFTVALGAALRREQISILPPSDAPNLLAQLTASYADAYCLYDGAVPPAVPVPSMPFPEEGALPVRGGKIPVFPADQPAVLLFTSGSTGRPMPHRKSWGCLAQSALAAGARLGAAKLPGAVIIATVPQQHSYGLESTVLLPLQHGLVLQSTRPFYPGDVTASIASAPRPRILVTTPIHLRAILADGDRLPPLDLIVSATAPLSRQLADEAERRFGCALLEIYGCSEAGQLAVRRTVESEQWRCLDGASLRQDAAGTWAAGAVVEGEVLLNDVIDLRGPEHFVLYGRQDDLINIAGKRTSLAYLNYHLTAIPGVSDGTFMMPEESGEATTRLMALVVAPGLSSDAILSALRQRIDPAFLPRPLLLVESLPRNVVGKLPREAIRDLAHQRSS